MKFISAFNRKVKARFGPVTGNVLIAFMLFLITMILLIGGEADLNFRIGWLVVAAVAIFLYWKFTTSVLPKAFEKKKRFRRYIAKASLWTIGISFLIMLIGSSVWDEEDLAMGISIGNFFFQHIVTIPITWWLYKQLTRSAAEVKELQQELGQTHASMDFLRSQINPHFLFNALNTIYGTAIQEKADRTGEAVQKLGDMMRFMLHENVQDIISLHKEIDYLNNYIALQKLRTDPVSTIEIETEIPQPRKPLRIAPMLLIPFVENAFKHGISLQNPSRIWINLDIDGDIIEFVVTNTLHPKQKHDPEKDKSGIGLENVKQRLQLLYPNRHELEIRETANEFFIHLTLQLNESNSR